MSDAPPVTPARKISERLQLATLALHAARSVTGVRGVHAGPGGRLVTSDRSTQVDGVQCVASGQDGYEVTVGLICAPVDLIALGAQVQSAIKVAGQAQGLPVNRVSVQILDVAYEMPA